MGQTLVEFAVSLSLAAAVLGSASWLLRGEWERGKCAYLVFERTHARLVGLAKPWMTERSAQIVIIEEPTRIRGEGRCGSALEKVNLTRLEAARL